MIKYVDVDDDDDEMVLLIQSNSLNIVILWIFEQNPCAVYGIGAGLCDFTLYFYVDFCCNRGLEYRPDIARPFSCGMQCEHKEPTIDDSLCMFVRLYV